MIRSNGRHGNEVRGDRASRAGKIELRRGSSAVPILPGSSVRFEDAQGRFVAGTVIDDESFRVVESNVYDVWTVFYKHPFWTWEECLEFRGRATRLKPRALAGFKKLIELDWRQAS